MTNDSPAMLAVAPNGARKTQADHPALPISPAELASTAHACMNSGATMIHLHVRDQHGGHSLDPERYLQAIAAVRTEVGDGMVIQITTEAVGIYQPEEQMECVKKVKPEAVSIALKEFIPEPGRNAKAGKFFEWMYQQEIAPQFILYSQEDVEHFNKLHQQGLIQSDQPNVLLVLGRYTKDQQSDPDELPLLLEQVSPSYHWWLCAFGRSEQHCMTEAMKLGGHCRVGFENNLLNEEGLPAKDNGEQIEKVAGSAAARDRGLANAAETRLLMGVR